MSELTMHVAWVLELTQWGLLVLILWRLRQVKV